MGRGVILDQMDAAIKRANMDTAETAAFFDKWIFNYQHRKLMKLIFCHQLTYEKAAEQMRPEISVRQAKRDVKLCVSQLVRRL